MKCIVCEKEISEVHMSGHIFYMGSVQNIIPGYGSCHDLKKIEMGLCDSCLTKAEENKTINILGEY